MANRRGRRDGCVHGSARHTSIANVALPYMAGNLGASNDESTWILTSYLVSNAIVLPISGWFAGVFGRKRFFMICLSVFTLSSLLCGIAPGLGTIILFRIIQGTGGGGLQPMAQAILADVFPPRQRGLAFALYGITTIIAPTIGPTLGGWITDNYSWRWIFFINLPVGILALFLVYRLVEDPPWAKRVPGAGIKIDYIGVSLLVIGVGALQVLLDKGQEEDWFGSTFIVALAIIAGIGLILLVVWEWVYKNPIVEVRLFKNLNFLGANFMMFVLGLMFFASLVYAASVPPDGPGLYGRECRSRSFRRRSAFAVSDACYRDAVFKDSRALHYRVRLADTQCGDVLHHTDSQPRHQLRICDPAAHLPSLRTRFPIRTCQSGRVRWNATSKKQQCRRTHQLHAQYGLEYRNVDGHHRHRATRASASVVSVGTFDARRVYVHSNGERADVAVHDIGFAP
jgi:MFS family permease